MNKKNINVFIGGFIENQMVSYFARIFPLMTNTSSEDINIFERSVIKEVFVKFP